MKNELLDFYRRYSLTLLDIGVLIGSIYLVMTLISSFYQMVPSLFLALIFYVGMLPVLNLFQKMGVSDGKAATVTLFLYVFLLVGIIGLLSWMLLHVLGGFVDNLPHYTESVQEGIRKWAHTLQDQSEKIPHEVMEKGKEEATGFIKSVSLWFGAYLSKGVQTFSSLSVFGANFLIGLILAFLLAKERKDWEEIMGTKTPKTLKMAGRFVYRYVLFGIKRYLVAQAKLISCTFFIVLAALFFLGVKNPLGIALLCAFFDILPIFGIAAVLIPWGIYSLIVGNTTFGICILVLWGTISLFRHVVEPKLVGDSLGVSAFFMLVMMMVSLKLFGVAGIFMAPILVILFKSLYTQGYLARWIRKPEKEYE